MQTPGRPQKKRLRRRSKFIDSKSSTDSFLDGIINEAEMKEREQEKEN